MDKYTILHFNFRTMEKKNNNHWKIFDEMVICENLLRIFIVTNSDNLKILEEMKHTILAIDDERSIRILLDNRFCHWEATCAWHWHRRTCLFKSLFPKSPGSARQKGVYGCWIGYLVPESALADFFAVVDIEGSLFEGTRMGSWWLSKWNTGDYMSWWQVVFVGYRLWRAYFSKARWPLLQFGLQEGKETTFCIIEGYKSILALSIRAYFWTFYDFLFLYIFEKYF